MSTEKRELMCVLTESEWKERAKDHARFSQRKEQLQDQNKQQAAEMKERISGCSAQIKKLRRAVLKGAEPREVECEWRADFHSRQRHLTRLDTNEVIQSVTMTLDELQGSLSLTPDEAEQQS